MPVQLVVIAVAAAVAAAATAIAAAIAAGELEKARQIREKVISQYGDDIVPKLDKAIAHEAGPTGLAQIQVDPETRDTQRDAMRKLSSLYESGGMGQGDEAALELANEGAQQRSSSDYQSLQQSLAARGQTMNPALAAAMAAQSGGQVVQATARNRYMAQADARQRAYSALRDSSTIAGNIHSQDYNEQAARASAQDRINQFNAGQRTAADNENARRETAMASAREQLARDRAGAYENIARGYGDSARNAQGAGAGIANAAMSVGAGAAGGAGGGGGGAAAYGPSGDYEAPGGPGGGAPAYGGAGSMYDTRPRSQPDEWENPYLPKK